MCSVRRWMIRITRRVRLDRAAHLRRRPRASPLRRAGGSPSRCARKIAITTSRMPIARLPAASQRGSPVTSAMLHADQRDASARRARPMSSSSTTGSSGTFVSGMNRHSGSLAPHAGSSRRARSGTTSASSTIAKRADADREPGALELVRMAQLLDALVDREQAADAEQHERDDERPEVAPVAVAERVLVVGGPVGGLAAVAAAIPDCRCRRPSGSPRPASTRRR